MIILVILLIALQGYACFKLFKTNALHKILALSIIFYSVLWIILPGVISLLIYFGPLEERISSGLITDNYFSLYSLESAIFLAAVAGGTYLSNRTIGATIQQTGKQPARRFAIAALMGFALVAGTLFMLGAGADYLERNNATNYDNNRTFVILAIFYSILGAAVTYFAITLKSNRRTIITLLFISLLFAASIDTLNGSRIAMLLPIFVFFCRMHFHSKSLTKKTIKITILTTILVSLLMPVAITIGKMRVQGEMSINMIMKSKESTPIADVAADLFTKFNSFSAGLDLIDGFGPGSAGIRPYVGSLLVFLPRFIFPDRPVAGSIDGTIYGTPARLVPQLKGGSDSWNVGVSPYAISVWHFNWLLGANILIFAGILNLLLLNYLLTRNGVAYKLLAIYAIKIPTFVGIFNSPDALLKNAVEIGIMATLVAVFLMLFYLPFRRGGALHSPTLRRFS